MLAQAQAIDRNAGLSLRYVNARAEDTGLLSASFDIVTAGTCWHWFKRPAAARANRVGYSSAMGTLPVRGGTFTSMNITLLKALVALVPTSMLLSASVLCSSKERLPAQSRGLTGLNLAKAHISAK
jgi:hypothetical protein